MFVVLSMPSRLFVRAAENLSNARDAKASVDIAARIGAHGRLHAAGALATDPLAGDWRIDVRAIDLAPLRPYFEDRTNVIVTSGALSAKGRLAYRGATGAAFLSELTKISPWKISERSSGRRTRPRSSWIGVVTWSPLRVAAPPPQRGAR